MAQLCSHQPYDPFSVKLLLVRKVMILVEVQILLLETDLGNLGIPGSADGEKVVTLFVKEYLNRVI